MPTHADKTLKNTSVSGRQKSQSVSNVESQTQNKGEYTFQFVDNRAETFDRQNLQEMANNSQMAIQLKALQELANRKNQTAQPTQLKATGDKYPNKKIIQKRKYSDKLIKSEIKFIAKDVQPNKTSIILAVYNQMRHELDPTPGKFNTIMAGRKAMIAAGKIDDEDADYLEAQAELRQKAGGNPAELLRMQAEAKIDEKYDAVDAKYGHHIFTGDFKKGNPTGFHSKAGNSATHEAYGAKTDVDGTLGTYQQSVHSKADNSKKKTNQSTFFPDNATRQNIIKAITSVYEAGFKNVTYVDPTVDGLSLTKRGDTVYPAGGSDDLLAE